MAFVYVDGGKRYASLKAEVALAGGRSRGTFTGRFLPGHVLRESRVRPRR